MENPIPGAIVQVKTMARSVRITFDSQEILTPAQMAELFALYEKVGWFFFLDGNRPLDVDLMSLPDLKPEEGKKSRAVRLRNVLFRVWEKEHKGNPKSLYKDALLRQLQEVEVQIGEVRERVAKQFGQPTAVRGAKKSARKAAKKVRVLSEKTRAKMAAAAKKRWAKAKKAGKKTLG